LVTKIQEIIPIEQWKMYTKILNNNPNATDTIQWLWDYIESLSLEKQSKFIEFFSGSTCLPIGNLKQLSENNRPFTIYIANEVDKLPSATTCFYKVNLSLFTSKNILFEKFDIAISTFNGFQFM